MEHVIPINASIPPRTNQMHVEATFRRPGNHIIITIYSDGKQTYIYSYTFNLHGAVT